MFGSKKELKMLKLELAQRRVAFIGERSSSERSFLREDATEERERERYSSEKKKPTPSIL